MAINTSVVGNYVGAAIAIYINNYLDVRVSPLVRNFKNSTISNTAFILGSVLYARAGTCISTNKGSCVYTGTSTFGDAITGAGTWAVGKFMEPYIKSHVQGLTTTTPGVTITPTTSPTITV